MIKKKANVICGSVDRVDKKANLQNQGREISVKNIFVFNTIVHLKYVS